MVILHQCIFCKHFQGHKGTNSLCEAFPEGIPDAIFNNEFDHRQPYPDDNGIRFEQSEKSLQHIGVIYAFELEKDLLPNWRKLQGSSPNTAIEETEQLKTNIQRFGRQFRRGGLTRREYESRVISVLRDFDDKIGWSYLPDFSWVDMLPLDPCPGCKATLRWDRYCSIAYIDPDDSNLIICGPKTYHCPQCGSSIREERLVTYKPSCDICGREAGPDKRSRCVMIDYNKGYDNPRRWKCEECSAAKREPEQVS